MTFEAYALERWALKKSSAYELMDGAAAYELARPIAEKLRIEFTAPPTAAAGRPRSIGSEGRATVHGGIPTA